MSILHEDGFERCFECGGSLGVNLSFDNLGQEIECPHCHSKFEVEYEEDDDCGYYFYLSKEEGRWLTT